MEASPLAREDLVYAPERVWFGVVVLVSLLIWAGLGLLAASSLEAGSVILFYGTLLALLAFFAHALAIGRVRGNGVRVSEHQLPFLHQLVVEHSRRLGLPAPPTVYVLESGGLLNAFAAKLLGRRFVIVNADILAMAVRRSPAAVSFVVGHELGHHWRGHLTWNWLIAPARLVPYLGAAYSRACEYTCDRVGAYCEPGGAIDGLLVLAAGGWLHTHIDVQAFADQATTDADFWVRRAELVSSHPRLPKRVAALLALGIAAPAPQPLVASEAAA